MAVQSQIAPCPSSWIVCFPVETMSLETCAALQARTQSYQLSSSSDYTLSTHGSLLSDCRSFSLDWCKSKFPPAHHFSDILPDLSKGLNIILKVNTGQRLMYQFLFNDVWKPANIVFLKETLYLMDYFDKIKLKSDTFIEQYFLFGLQSSLWKYILSVRYTSIASFDQVYIVPWC